MEERRVNWSRWSVHDTKEECGYKTPFSHYNQTLGLGYYEYFILCEYLGASPVPVMNVGLACQYQSTQKVASDSVEFKEFVQDALDLIEFANGDVSTNGGAARCLRTSGAFRASYAGHRERAVGNRRGGFLP